jgi:phosphatidylglycerophosphate synthase
MTERWVLLLDPPRGDASRVVGGLAVAKRLALDAQAAGAEAVVAPPDLRTIPADRRLKIPIIAHAPEGANVVRIPASFVVHRQLFKALGGASRNLDDDPFPLDVPWGFEPVDVVDGAAAASAERALFQSLRKTQDGWTSRWLNRYISLAVSRLLVKTPLTPNQVSVGILAIGILAAVLAARGSWGAMALGAFLFQAQSVLDGCDGELSRITHRGSLLGEWLDTIGDDVTNYGFFAGAAWGLYAQSGHKLYLVAGAVTVLCGVITSAIEYRYLVKIGSGDLLKYPISAGGGGEEGGVFSKIQPLFKRDTFVFLTFLAALIGLLGPMLVIFSLGAIGILITVILAELRMARERRV